MGKKIDLTDQRFGRLVVIEEGEKEIRKSGTRIFWKCRCDCGKEVRKRTDRLINGLTTSCGTDCVIRAEKKYIGKTYNKLTVISIEKKDKKGRIYVKTICECGKESLKRIDSLKNGETKSCGCLINENLTKNRKVYLDKKRESDLFEGTSLSSLTMKIPTDNKSGHKGVFYDKRLGMWLAYLTFQGESKLREYYESKTDAINARKEAEEKYFNPMLDKYGKESK